MKEEGFDPAFKKVSVEKLTECAKSAMRMESTSKGGDGDGNRKPVRI